MEDPRDVQKFRMTKYSSTASSEATFSQVSTANKIGRKMIASTMNATTKHFEIYVVCDSFDHLETELVS